MELIGHKVFCAENAMKSYALLLQENPDLIIVDVMMPEVDGFTLVQRIRNNPEFEQTPILMLTALGMLEDKVKDYRDIFRFLSNF